MKQLPCRGYHNSLVVRAHEVDWGFRFDVLESSIDVGNVWLCHDPFHIVRPHKYDNLFPRGTLSHHVYFQFTFLAWFAHGIVDFRDLIKREFREGVLDLEYFHDVALGRLSVRLFVVLRVWVNWYIFLEKVRLRQDTFAEPQRNGRRNSRNVSLFSFTFIRVRWSLLVGRCLIELSGYALPKGYVLLISCEFIPTRFINCRKKFPCLVSSAEEPGLICERPKSVQGQTRTRPPGGGILDNLFSRRYLVKARARFAPAESPSIIMLSGM